MCFVVPDILGKLALLATNRPVDEDDGGVLAYTRQIEEASNCILWGLVTYDNVLVVLWC